jgi:hypothetical protein
MFKLDEEDSNFQSDLWIASCEIRALGEMLMNQQREPASDEEDVWFGYGSVLRRIGEHLETWAKRLDANAAVKTQRKKSKRK